MASPKRSNRRGSSPCGKRAPDWEAPRLFFASASYEKFDPCRRIGSRRSNLRLRAFAAAALCKLAVAPSPLRPLRRFRSQSKKRCCYLPCYLQKRRRLRQMCSKLRSPAFAPHPLYAKSLRPEVSMLSSSASAPSRVSSFANT